MSDPFGTVDSVTAPARGPFAVTPHDSDALPIIPKALYVGTGGTLVVRGVDASADVTFRNVAAGQVLEVRARYIRATGTTAADLVALA
jgi:hypothetical protein